MPLHYLSAQLPQICPSPITPIPAHGSHGPDGGRDDAFLLGGGGWTASALERTSPSSWPSTSAAPLYSLTQAHNRPGLSSRQSTPEATSG